jgi:HEAT repeat protein
VVVERQTVVVQPKQVDKETQALFEALRYKKSELFKKLATGDKEQRREAIDELGGFSFDDGVRQALENVLLSDPDPELRQEVAQAFGEVKNTKALAALEKARVEDSSVDVRKAADKSIKKIEGAAS